MALPTLTCQQRQDALRVAAAARRARKQLCDAIARGELSIPEVLDRATTDSVVARTRVTQLLKSLPGDGEAKVTALMEHTGIAPSRRVAWVSANAGRCATRCDSRPAVCEAGRKQASSVGRDRVEIRPGSVS
jgi:hypothetical protein